MEDGQKMKGQGAEEWTKVGGRTEVERRTKVEGQSEFNFIRELFHSVSLLLLNVYISPRSLDLDTTGTRQGLKPLNT